MKPIALQNVVGHVQSVEDLNRTKIALPQAGRKLASEQPSDSNCDSSLSLQPAGLPHQALDLPNLHHHGSQLFKINFSFYASCGFCDSRTLAHHFYLGRKDSYPNEKEGAPETWSPRTSLVSCPKVPPGSSVQPS